MTNASRQSYGTQVRASNSSPDLQRASTGNEKLEDRDLFRSAGMLWLLHAD
jgi:hypothetical protein